MKQFEKVIGLCVSVLLFLSLFLFGFSAGPISSNCGNFNDIVDTFNSRSGWDVSSDDLFGDTGGGGGGGCTPSCGTCTPPPCPAGTDGTARDNCAAPGTSCNRGSDGCGGSCGTLTRSCWYLENAPAPTAPQGITYKIGTLSCNLGTGTRVPYPAFGTGDGFRSFGSQNGRATDPIRGLAPLLRYRYIIPELSLNSGYLATSTYYAPSLLTSEGSVLTIRSWANSINRCLGNTSGPEITRTFKINNVPEVLSIEPVQDPNDGVSGNIDYDGSNFDFDCEVDNPKAFRVVFADEDGCGDIWEGYNAFDSNNICGGPKTRNLSLRAVDSVTGVVFAPLTENEISGPYNVSCEGNQLTAYFDLTLVGTENVDLTIEAKANDIVGDTSGWVARTTWLYDGLFSGLEIDANIITGADEIKVDWFAEDNSPTRAGVYLSGIRSVRISALLNEGDILRLERDDDGNIVGGDNYYSSIVYEGVEVFVNESFGVFLQALFINTPEFPIDLTGENIVEIGKNQDGSLEFKIEAVDRACNHNDEVDELELGTPWIATRGGFVHSFSNISLAVKRSLYSDIIPSLLGNYPNLLSGEDGERTSLSTETVTTGGIIEGFSFDDTESHFFPSLQGYTKSLSLNRPWYLHFLSRAELLDEGKTMWDLVRPEQEESYVVLTEDQLAVCEGSQFVYFIEGDLHVEPDKYEQIALPVGSKEGCIFIVKDNLLISDGAYKSAGAVIPEYDVVRGYFVVDGEIDLAFVDRGEDVRDGLKIVGGLFATGGDKSVRLGRTLQLKDNLLYPTVIIFHDARYLDVARQVIGDTFGGGYIRDVGFIE